MQCCPSCLLHFRHYSLHHFSLSSHTHTAIPFIPTNLCCIWFCSVSLYDLAGQQCTPSLNACNSAAAHHGLWCSSLSSNHRAEYLPSISYSACPLCGCTRGCKPIFKPLPYQYSLSLSEMDNKTPSKQLVTFSNSFAEALQFLRE